MRLLSLCEVKILKIHNQIDYYNFSGTIKPWWVLQCLSTIRKDGKIDGILCILSFGRMGIKEESKKWVKTIKATSVHAPLHAFDHFSFGRMHFQLRKVVFTRKFWPPHMVKFDFSWLFLCMECGIVHFMAVTGIMNVPTVYLGKKCCYLILFLVVSQLIFKLDTVWN